MTQNQVEFEKQIKRITRLLKRLSREDEFILPPRPTRVTKKKIERLKAITTSVIKTIPVEHDETGKRKKQLIDIRKARRIGGTDEVKTGYRRGHPENLQHKGNPHGNPENLQHKGNPHGNPQNLQHKGNPRGNPQNLQHKGNKNPFSNLTPEQRSERAKKAAQTRKERGWKPSFKSLTPEELSQRAKKAAQTRKELGKKPFGNLTPEQRSARAKKAWETRRKREEEKEKEKYNFETPSKKKDDDEEFVFTTPDSEGNGKKINTQTGETFSYTPYDKIDIPTIDTCRLIVNNFIEEIQMAAPNSPFASTIIDKILEWCQLFGYDALAAALVSAKEEGNVITYRILYNKNGEGERYLQEIGLFLADFMDNGIDSDLIEKISEEAALLDEAEHTWFEQVKPIKQERWGEKYNIDEED